MKTQNFTVIIEKSEDGVLGRYIRCGLTKKFIRDLEISRDEFIHLIKSI